MENNIKFKLLDCIIYGKFDEAKKMASLLGFEQMYDLLYSSVYENGNICLFGFAIYMFEQDKDTRWLQLAETMMVSEFCYIEGAYPLALFLLRNLVEIEPSVEHLCWLLDFYKDIHVCFGEDEAREIAKRVLLIDPNNKTVYDMFPDLFL